MSNQKTPISRTLPSLIDSRVQAALDKLGKALPAKVESVTGPIVTVSFEVEGANLPQVTMPLFGPEYIRYPIQQGDLGVCFPADVYIGGVSGLGGGTADLTLRANLSTLVFFPIGNSGWSSVDPNAVTIYGPNGVVLRDTESKTTATLTPSGLDVESTDGTLTFSAGGHSIVIDSTGVIIDGRVFLAHEHTGVTTGSDPTGGVV